MSVFLISKIMKKTILFLLLISFSTLIFSQKNKITVFETYGSKSTIKGIQGEVKEHRTIITYDSETYLFKVQLKGKDPVVFNLDGFIENPNLPGYLESDGLDDSNQKVNIVLVVRDPEEVHILIAKDKNNYISYLGRLVTIQEK